MVKVKVLTIFFGVRGFSVRRDCLRLGLGLDFFYFLQDRSGDSSGFVYDQLSVVLTNQLSLFYELLHCNLQFLSPPPSVLFLLLIAALTRVRILMKEETKPSS